MLNCFKFGFVNQTLNVDLTHMKLYFITIRYSEFNFVSKTFNIELTRLKLLPYLRHCGLGTYYNSNMYTSARSRATSLHTPTDSCKTVCVCIATTQRKWMGSSSRLCQCVVVCVCVYICVCVIINAKIDR